MKIIAQSTVAPKLPYLHIAYLAATTMKHTSHTVAIASSFMIAGIVLLLVRLPRKKWKSLFKKDGKSKKSLKYKVISFLGKLCIIISVVLFFFGQYFFGKKGYSHVKALTKSRMIRAASDYKVDKIEKKADSLEKYPAKNKNVYVDAWDNPMKIEKKISDGKPVISIISSGEDGTFDTEDDIRNSFDIPDVKE